ncbi:hypothetical protein OAG75_00260 [bacterium]|nr:hypothetical protein [bacterium]MDB4793052.1 hypothetical protein [bacterium]
MTKPFDKMVVDSLCFKATGNIASIKGLTFQNKATDQFQKLLQAAEEMELAAKNYKIYMQNGGK